MARALRKARFFRLVGCLLGVFICLGCKPILVRNEPKEQASEPDFDKRRRNFLWTWALKSLSRARTLDESEPKIRLIRRLMVDREG